MLTSAPFDNWWHNAYGLDVKIVSPPHTLLILGIRARWSRHAISDFGGDESRGRDGSRRLQTAAACCFCISAG